MKNLQKIILKKNKINFKNIIYKLYKYYNLFFLSSNINSRIKNELKDEVIHILINNKKSNIKYF